MIEKLNLRTPESKNVERIVETPVIQEEPKQKKEKENIWTKFFKKEKLKNVSNVYVLYKRLNGTAEPSVVECDSKGMFLFNKKTYHMRGDCKFWLVIKRDRFPLLIQEEDGLVPDGNADYYKVLTTKEAIQREKEVQRRCAEHQDLAIKAIRHAEIVRMSGETGNKMNPKIIIGVVILLIVGFALLKNYI